MSKGKWKPETPFTEQQKTAVRMLYDGDPVQDVASALGVHRTTIWRWKRKRQYRKEWNRINRNEQRRCERIEARMYAEREKYWEEKRQKAEEKLLKMTENLSINSSKRFNSAWNEYERALFGGFSMAEVYDILQGKKPRRRKAPPR